MNKILIIGDVHLKDNLSYSEYISDGRIAEKKEILDFIVKQSEDCTHVVFMGDFFNARNNSSEANREAVELLERFDNKDVYIISGNHEKKGDGKTAIDFIGEIKKSNWHIFTKPGTMSFVTKHQSVGFSTKAGEPLIKMDFLPYMLNSELDVQTSEEGSKQIMSYLEGGDILFAHHSISGTSFNGIKTDTLNEIVLPKAKLEKKYKLVVAGHIHVPQQYGNVLITGSVFTAEVGEEEKFIWKLNEKMEIEKIKLPCREIHKLEDPAIEHLDSLPKNSIVKVIVTKKETDIEKLNKRLEKFDAHLLIEDFPDERKKAHIEEGAMDFSIESLLKLYSEEKGVSLEKLLKGLSIINNE